MKICLNKITSAHPDCKHIKRLYNSAFPSEERAPFRVLANRSVKDCVDFLSIHSGDEFIGFAYVVNYNDLSYLFYFAVEEKYRGMGFGSDVLKALKQRYSDRRLFLAIETLDENADNYDMRVRRKNFYMRNGFEDLKSKIREGSMYYSALGIGGDIGDEEFRLLMNNYLGKFLSLFVKTGMYKEN